MGCSPGLLASGGKLFAIGGFAEATYEPMAEVEVFDPAVGHWAPVARMAIARAEFGSAVGPDGVICVAGNYGDSDSDSGYDPKLDRWFSVTSMPVPRTNCAAGVLGDSFYVLGGSGGKFFEPLRSTDRLVLPPSS